MKTQSQFRLDYDEIKLHEVKMIKTMNTRSLKLF